MKLERVVGENKKLETFNLEVRNELGKNYVGKFEPQFGNFSLLKIFSKSIGVPFQLLDFSNCPFQIDIFQNLASSS